MGMEDALKWQAKLWVLFETTYRLLLELLDALLALSRALSGFAHILLREFLDPLLALSFICLRTSIFGTGFQLSGLCIVDFLDTDCSAALFLQLFFEGHIAGMKSGESLGELAWSLR